MKTTKTITVSQFCVYYNVPESFIDSLSAYELVDLIQKDQNRHIKENQIVEIEKLMRLHYDLEVNFEGLDVITNLISKIHSLQKSLNKTQNKLDFHKLG